MTLQKLRPHILILFFYLVSTGLSAHAVESICPGGSNPDPNVIFCDDFESGNLNAWDLVQTPGVINLVTPPTNTSIVNSPLPFASTRALKVDYFISSSSIGHRDDNRYVRKNFGQTYSRLFFRGYLMIPKGTTMYGVDTQGNQLFSLQRKFLYIWTAEDNAQESVTLTSFSKSNDPDHTWLAFTGTPGGAGAATVYWDRYHFPVGEWVLVEIEVQLNSPGQNDGRLQLWINNQLQETISNISLSDGSLDLSHFFVGQQLDRGDNLPVDLSESRYWDNIVVSRAYIGPVGSSSPPDTQAPTDPGSLAASVISSTQVNLSWSAATDNVGVTGYRIFRNGIQVGTSTTTSFSNTGLSPNTTYSFTVAAHDAAGNNSTQSASVNATTLAVSSIPMTCSQWNSTTGTLLCEDWETTSTLPPYNLLNGWGWNTNWNQATRGGTVCGSLGYQSNCSLTLKWPDDPVGDENIDSVFPEHAIPAQPATGEVYARFYIKYSSSFQWNVPGAKVFYIRSDSGGNFSWAVQLGSKPESNSNLSGPGKFYLDLQVHNLMLNQNIGTAAQGRVTKDVWHAVEMYAKPNSIVGTSDGHVKVWLNGSLMMDYPNVDVRSHAVNPASNINGVWISAYIGGPTDPHPAQQIWYDHIVVSKSPPCQDAQGNSMIGPIGCTGSTPPPVSDFTAPTVPTGLAAAAVSVTQINLSWSAATDNVGVTGYRLERCTGAECTNFIQIAAPTGTSFQNTTVIAGTTYQYRMRATDAAGNLSGYSSIVSATTPSAPTPPPDTTPPSGSTIITLIPTEDTFLNLNATNHSPSLSLNTYTWPANSVANAILMKFNLAGIPLGSTVSSASLNLTLTETDATADALYAIPVHKVIGVNPNLALATGYTYDGTNFWSGGSSTVARLTQGNIGPAIDTRSINKTLGVKTWTVTSLIQDWLTNPSTNFGILLNSDTSRGSDRYRFFASREHAVVNSRPSLTVTYTAPSTPPPDTTPPAIPQNVRVE